jgi:hypothetical protein
VERRKRNGPGAGESQGESWQGPDTELLQRIKEGPEALLLEHEAETVALEDG